MEKSDFEITWEEPLHIEEITYSNKTYYLFDRHRISLLCWLRAFKEGYIPKDNLLITIDKHCDFFTNDLKKRHISLAKSLDLKKICNNIKDNNKQDFIIMAMEIGIVKNLIIISPVINKSEFPQGLPKTYIDSNGNTHKATYFSSIEEFEEKFSNVLKDPLILDIDLDYFQNHIIDSSLPVRKWRYTKKTTKEQRKSFFKPKTKLNKIYHKAKIITLAKEMKYSEGRGKKWVEELLELFLYLERKGTKQGLL